MLLQIIRLAFYVSSRHWQSYKCCYRASGQHCMCHLDIDSHINAAPDHHVSILLLFDQGKYFGLMKKKLLILIFVLFFSFTWFLTSKNLMEKHVSIVCAIQTFTVISVLLKIIRCHLDISSHINASQDHLDSILCAIQTLTVISVLIPSIMVPIQKLVFTPLLFKVINKQFFE